MTTSLRSHEALDGLTAVVVHARDVGPRLRTAFAKALEPHPIGGVVIETCQRVEVVTWRPVPATLIRAAPTGMRCLQGQDVVDHVVRLAVGRESAVIGEDQVLHQLRQAVAAAREHGLEPRLERLFAMALHAGRSARSWRTGPARSLADVAVEALDLAPPIGSRTVLVAGTGAMGRLAIRAAQRAGALVVVASRTAASARRAARDLGASATLGDGVAVDGVVVALRGPWIVPDELAAELLAADPVVADLSVPSAVPDLLRTRLTRVIGIDALAGRAAGSAAVDDAWAARVDHLVGDTAEAFRSWLTGQAETSVARSLAGRAEATRRTALEHLWRDLPDLDATSREAIERMAADLAERLLREPFARLRDDRDGRVRRSIRDVFAL